MVENLASWAALMLRVGGGIVFMAHGFPKLLRTEKKPEVGRTRLKDAIEKLGFPYPLFFAYVVAAMEFLGGIFLVLGLFTPWVSLILAIVMLFATFWMQKIHGFELGADFPFALLFMMIALIFLGGGQFSLGALLGTQ